MQTARIYVDGLDVVDPPTCGEASVSVPSQSSFFDAIMARLSPTAENSPDNILTSSAFLSLEIAMAIIAAARTRSPPGTHRDILPPPFYMI